VAHHAHQPVTACIGIRINPQVGAGSIAALSTGVSTSKFGIGLDENREALLAAFKHHSFENGSCSHRLTGLSLDIMVDAIKKVAAFARELGPQVTVFDVGGGLSVNFKSDEINPTLCSIFSSASSAKFRMVFDGSCTVITEFGRSIVAKAGMLGSRDSTKWQGAGLSFNNIAATIPSVRTVWCPQVWPLRLMVFNGIDGILRTDDPVVSDVAGALALSPFYVHSSSQACFGRAVLLCW